LHVDLSRSREKTRLVMKHLLPHSERRVDQDIQADNGDRQASHGAPLTDRLVLVNGRVLKPVAPLGATQNGQEERSLRTIF
jgi:hypothetical protein